MKCPIAWFSGMVDHLKSMGSMGSGVAKTHLKVRLCDWSGCWVMSPYALAAALANTGKSSTSVRGFSSPIRGQMGQMCTTAGSMPPRRESHLSPDQEREVGPVLL